MIENLMKKSDGLTGKARGTDDGCLEPDFWYYQSTVSNTVSGTTATRNRMRTYACVVRRESR